MSQGKPNALDSDERYAALINNAGAIRAVCSAVEGTLGPKGLDAMLVGTNGEIIITNDGVTILDKMDVTHPAAKLLIQVARSQQREVGDGTTTATVLAGAMVQEGVSQVTRGVPPTKVVSGLQRGVALAIEALQRRARPVTSLDDPLLRQTAYIAGREQADIVHLVMEAAQRLGKDKLLDPQFHLADAVSAHEKADNEVWPGILLRYKPVHRHAVTARTDARVLVLRDALEPEQLGEELMATEAGLARYMELRQHFEAQLERLRALDIGLIVLERGIHPDAEQFCHDHRMIVLQRVNRDEIARICRLTGAVPMRRTALHKSEEEIGRMLGTVGSVHYDERLERVRLAASEQRIEGAIDGQTVTIIVGASTAEVVGERARIAADAASAVQAAVKRGILPGGGTTELAVAAELERHRDTVKGMETFGLMAVAQALSKPMAQIVLNAGFNPLEKVEEARAAQLEQNCDSIGVDCDTGGLIDYAELGIVDPALVKIHALQAAGEVAAAVLRIHNVIKMRQGGE
ncbi:TCP-1/cpn60 chaperonin family protein [Paenibacillus sp. MSJ-34]|uniref:TCP-1/cpn60 chaperonin family protein n=1 Tax=Paenibacillus sp. MSJ-34 TaxID=2841529 RepID=UPI001C0F5FBD|nr:TCP-1/cpn60 chaperonin family protein [Paenibacillus sp. MSJ-34]MBU5440435.1 TCP-1/cpn60 chaperonin family protein [Paenibacillus sp. MSJ-34]